MCKWRPLLQLSIFGVGSVLGVRQIHDRLFAVGTLRVGTRARDRSGISRPSIPAMLLGHYTASMSAVIRELLVPFRFVLGALVVLWMLFVQVVLPFAGALLAFIALHAVLTHLAFGHF